MQRFPGKFDQLVRRRHRLLGTKERPSPLAFATALAAGGLRAVYIRRRSDILM
jgi:hypothetical protein